MAKSGRTREEHYHEDGSVRARGWLRNGQLDGPWEWFRKDGTRMRAGQFDNGVRTGDWTTFDVAGQP